MKTLGIIGGMGPMASAYFLQLLTTMTEASSDQEHIHAVLDSCTQIPDRTSFILGQSSEDPFPHIVESGQRLIDAGCDVIAMTCNTSHYFFDRIEQSLSVPMINLIRESANYLKERGINKAGLMATDGTVSSGLYQKEFAAAGIEVVVPSAEYQKAVMHIIYDNVKAGTEPELPLFYDIARSMVGDGAQVIVLGCTELPLVKRDAASPASFIDPMEVMAMRAIRLCGGKLRSEYDNLIKR